jgi:hypothetical protein
MMCRHAGQLLASETPLPDRLSAVLASGLAEREACVFLAAMLEKCSSVKPQDFSDQTGYECFVNHIHIDDYGESDMLRVAVAFMARVSDLLRETYVNVEFRGLISVDESGVTARFHRLRAGQEWLSSDLEGYEEGVCEYAL